ncbi:hypothetical protein BKA70DRAFT_1242818 [Coprinopsis sp. MPI-PUGE-AT-0042]|nr:hypothetical protein BKA70DRAFT_1242818 [Coprinopsis sp. MPI-PUGE-AT-0042]
MATTGNHQTPDTPTAGNTDHPSSGGSSTLAAQPVTATAQEEPAAASTTGCSRVRGTPRVASGLGLEDGNTGLPLEHERDHHAYPYDRKWCNGPTDGSPNGTSARSKPGTSVSVIEPDGSSGPSNGHSTGMETTIQPKQEPVSATTALKGKGTTQHTQCPNTDERRPQPIPATGAVVEPPVDPVIESREEYGRQKREEARANSQRVWQVPYHWRLPIKHQRKLKLEYLNHKLATVPAGEKEKPKIPIVEDEMTGGFYSKPKEPSPRMNPEWGQANEHDSESKKAGWDPDKEKVNQPGAPNRASKAYGREPRV